MEAGEKKTVLVSPLDWGLGHATRIIPLARLLQEQGFKVVIGSYGRSAVLLKKELSGCIHVEIEGFSPRYSSSFSQSLALMFQSLSFLYRKRKEHERTAQVVKEHDVDLIISDNRYGVRQKGVRSVIITHQLSPELNGFPGFFKGIAARYFSKWISRFDECWVPDIPEGPGISGRLSANRYGIKNVKRIGILSRFEKCKEAERYEYDHLAVISGPEPLRTMFEKDVTELFSRLGGRSVVVRGLPEGDIKGRNINGITFFDHLDAVKLNSTICRSRNIVCRSGYSSLMDLFRAGRRAFLVPTPGQPEQEYLAEHLSASFGFITVEQKNISGIDTAIFEKFDRNIDTTNMDLSLKLPEITGK